MLNADTSRTNSGRHKPPIVRVLAFAIFIILIAVLVWIGARARLTGKNTKLSLIQIPTNQIPKQIPADLPGLDSQIQSQSSFALQKGNEPAHIIRKWTANKNFSETVAAYRAFLGKAPWQTTLDINDTGQQLFTAHNRQLSLRVTITPAPVLSQTIIEVEAVPI